MREILFRGKRIDNGEWVYGNFVLYEHMGEVKHIIVTDWAQVYVNSHFVIPETVGQDTGLKGKNGKKIFEGDIVREHANDYTPIYQNGIYMAYNVDKINNPYVSTQFNVIWRNGCEIIGNVHDNPELMKLIENIGRE